MGNQLFCVRLDQKLLRFKDPFQAPPLFFKGIVKVSPVGAQPTLAAERLLF